MPRPTSRLSLPSGVALLALACGGGDAPATGVLHTPRLLVTGDSVAAAGQSLVLNVAALDTAGARLPSSELVWSSSDDAVASVRCCGYSVVTVDTRSGGSAVITATYGTLQSSVTVRVGDTRPVVTMALGDVVTDTLVNGVSKRQYAVNLTVGDTVDLMVTRMDTGSGEILVGPSGNGPKLAPTTLVGLTGRQNIFPVAGAVAVPATGQYVLGAFGAGTTLRGTYTPASGAFTVAIRRSGPILSYGLGLHRSEYERAGDVAVIDTLYLQNLGTGALRVSLSADGAVLIGASSVTITQTSGPVYTSSPAGPGAQPIPVSFDATTLVPGAYTGTVHLRAPAGTWAMPRAYDVRYGVAAYDQRITVTGRTNLDGVASGSSGPVYAFSSGDFVSLDTATGATTVLFSLKSTIYHVTVAPDGSAYVATRASIIRYRPGQSPVTLTLPPGASTSAPPVGAIAAAPDGAVYARVYGLLYRIDASGTFTALSAVSRQHGQMAYSVPDTALYYIYDNTLYRYSIARNVEEVRASLQPLLLQDHVETIDSRGRLYVNRENVNGLWLYDSQGNRLQYIRVAGSTRGYALIGGTLIGVGLNGSSPGYTWKMPLP